MPTDDERRLILEAMNWAVEELADVVQPGDTVTVLPIVEQLGITDSINVVVHPMTVVAVASVGTAMTQPFVPQVVTARASVGQVVATGSASVSGGGVIEARGTVAEGIVIPGTEGWTAEHRYALAVVLWGAVLFVLLMAWGTGQSDEEWADAAKLALSVLTSVGIYLKQQMDEEHRR